MATSASPTPVFERLGGGYALYASLTEEQVYNLFGRIRPTAATTSEMDTTGLASPSLELHDPFGMATLGIDLGFDSLEVEVDRAVHNISNDWLPNWYPTAPHAYAAGMERENDSDEDEQVMVESVAGASLKPVPLHTPLISTPGYLEIWVARGELCSALDVRRKGALDSGTKLRQPQVDVVFTWVNGTDPAHRQTQMYWEYCMTTSSPLSKQVCPLGYSSSPLSNHSHNKHISRDARLAAHLVYEPQSTLTQKFTQFVQHVYPYLISQSLDPNQQLRNSNLDTHRHAVGASERRFAELGELRYAVRSAVRYVANLRTIHILSPDFPLNQVPVMAVAAKREQELTKPSVMFGLGSGAWRSEQDLLEDMRQGLDCWHSIDPVSSSSRAGQKPRWLNTNSSRVSFGAQAEREEVEEMEEKELGTSHSTNTTIRHPTLRLHHDWSIFRPLPSRNLQHMNPSRERIVSPTFNSMAIEAIVEQSTVGGLGQTYFVASDDFFFLRQLTSGDVASPLHGLVIRYSDTAEVSATQHRVNWGQQGQSPGLEVSAQILNRRFGTRPNRRLTPHVHRSADASLVHEMHQLFREDLTVAAKARFRGLGYNLVSHTLFASTVIERHREALLWSYLVLTLDANEDGVLDSHEWETLLQSMGRTPTNQPGALLPRRTSTAPRTMDPLYTSSGLPRPNATQYRFFSRDGYALPLIDTAALRQWIPRPPGRWSQDAPLQGGWPYYIPRKDRPYDTPVQPWDYDPDEGAHQTVCSFPHDRCLPLGTAETGKLEVKAHEAFTYIAFAHPECGDCLLTHLVQQSGRKGLSAFLPPATKRFSASGTPTHRTRQQVPHLPLTRTWHPTPNTKNDSRHSPNYAAAAISRRTGWSGQSMREFALQLLQRYTYTVGTSPEKFVMLTEERISTVLDDLEDESDELALLCINDDLVKHDRRDIELLHQFLDRRLPAVPGEVSFEL